MFACCCDLTVSHSRRYRVATGYELPAGLQLDERDGSLRGTIAKVAITYPTQEAGNAAAADLGCGEHYDLVQLSQIPSAWTVEPRSGQFCQQQPDTYQVVIEGYDSTDTTAPATRVAEWVISVYQGITLHEPPILATVGQLVRSPALNFVGGVGSITF